MCIIPSDDVGLMGDGHTNYCFCSKFPRMVFSGQFDDVFLAIDKGIPIQMHNSLFIGDFEMEGSETQ